MRSIDATYTDLVNLRDRLDDEQAKLNKQLEDVRRKLESVSMTLALLDEGETAGPIVATTDDDLSPAVQPSIDVVGLRGMTQLQALKKIAEHSGGTLRTALAKRLLIQAGLISNPKNANNIIFSVIHRSEAFERTDPGVYRLVGDKPTRPEKHATSNLEF